MLVDSLDFSPGGAEHFLLGLARHLPSDRFRVTVCSTRWHPGPLHDDLIASGIPHFTLDRRAKWDVGRLRRLVGFLRREQIDVLHAHKYGSNVWAALLGPAAGVPATIAHEQTWSYAGDPVRKLLDGRLIGRRADAFVAVSTADAARMVALEQVPPQKVVMLPNAYVPRRVPRPQDLRRVLRLAPDTPLVGTVCLLRPQKALEVLIDAFAELSPATAAHLVIGGDGPCRASLERQASAHGLAGRVHFVGMQPDARAVLADLDVAVMTSDFEGTPLFVCECMAQATPLVATAVGGIPDLVHHGRSAILVPPRDPSAVAVAVRSLLVDPVRRQALGAAAHRRLGLFSIDRVAGRFGDLYEALMRSDPPDPSSFSLDIEGA